MHLIVPVIFLPLWTRPVVHIIAPSALPFDLYAVTIYAIIFKNRWDPFSRHDCDPSLHEQIKRSRL